MHNLPITSYYSGLEQMLAFNAGTIGTFNPMLYGMAMPYQAMNPLSNPIFQQNLVKVGEQAFNQGRIDRASIDIQNAGSELKAMASQLSNILESDQLDKSQKERINALLEQVKQAQEELLQLTEKLSTSTDLNKDLKAIKSLQKKILNLREAGRKLSETIAKELEGKETSEEVAEQENVEESDNHIEESEEEVSDEDDKPSDKYDNDGRPSSLEKPSNREVQNICLAFSDAIGKTYLFGLTPGTDDEKFESAITDLDEHNVVEVMKHWKEKFVGAGNQYPQDKNFIESFLWDADHSQKQVLGKHILDMLVKRAELNGIDVAAEEAKIRAELNKYWISNDTVETNIEAIYNKIVAKEAENAQSIKDEKTEDKKVEDNKKSELNKKKQANIAKAKTTFLKDIKDCTGRDDIEEFPSDIEVITDEKGDVKGFKIRLKGKDYFGKDYLALQAALKEDNLTLPLPAKKEQVA